MWILHKKGGQMEVFYCLNAKSKLSSLKTALSSGKRAMYSLKRALCALERAYKHTYIHTYIHAYIHTSAEYVPRPCPELKQDAPTFELVSLETSPPDMDETRPFKT